MNAILLIVLGLLLGWLIEWVIDWLYWRRPPKTMTEEDDNDGDRPRNLELHKTAPTKKQLQANIQKLSTHNSRLAEVLAGMLSAPGAKGDSAEAMASSVQTGLASWFDDVMNRSTGEYKRKATKWAWLLGTILAFAFNVDSIEIATRMWREPTLRQVIVAQANNYQGTEVGTSLNEFVDQVNQLGIPVGWTTVPATDGQSCGWTPGLAVYPAIWTDNSCRILLNLPRMDDGWGWLLKFFGLAISGVATAQGAPFWFDMLKRLINIRSTGPDTKPARNITSNNS
jgi:predicted outer membrane lipoprotein